MEDIHDDAGPTKDHTRQTREAQGELLNLQREANTAGRMVPDGVVPTALLSFLEGIGVRGGEVVAEAAAITAEVCDALHWAELTRAREQAQQLEATGLHLTELIGGAGEETATCAECGERVRLLFHVERGTRQSNRVVDLADKRRGETAASRVAPVRGKATREAVASVHAESGVDVCLGCAAGVIAEARATAARREGGGRGRGSGGSDSTEVSRWRGFGEQRGAGRAATSGGAVLGGKCGCDHHCGRRP